MEDDRGGEGGGKGGWGGGDVRGYKIPKYQQLFSKNTALPYSRILVKIPIPKFFTASLVFAYISRQQDLNSFKIRSKFHTSYYI